MMDFLNEAPAAEPEIQTRERLPEQLQESRIELASNLLAMAST